MSLMASKLPALKSDCRSRRCENLKDFGKQLSRTMIDLRTADFIEDWLEIQEAA